MLARVSRQLGATGAATVGAAFATVDGRMAKRSPAGIVDAERRCLVCEWTGGVYEPDDTPDIGPPCPGCHAPTERVAVRRSWVRPTQVYASALAQLGASKGGRARAEALSPKRRQEIARAAALARWKRT
jgi:hypothetical protein